MYEVVGTREIKKLSIIHALLSCDDDDILMISAILMYYHNKSLRMNDSKLISGREKGIRN